MGTPEPRIALVTSAYNEGENLPALIAKCRRLGYRLLVVDDGSTDDTYDVGVAHGAEVIRHAINLGQAGGFLTAMRAAMRTDADIVVYIDADGQHDPESIPAFVARMKETGADIVVGSRVKGENHPNAPLMRRLMLPYVTGVINLLTGYKMTDAMCGFRAFNADRVRGFERDLVRMLESEYMASEMFIRFGHAGFTVDEVPIQLHDRKYGVSKKGMFRYGVGVARAILRALFDVKVRQ